MNIPPEYLKESNLPWEELRLAIMYFYIYVYCIQNFYALFQKTVHTVRLSAYKYAYKTYV